MSDCWSTLFDFVAQDEYDEEEIRKYTNEMNKNSPSKSSALHFAMIGGNLDTIRFLLKEKLLDVNIANVFGESPLHWACKAGSVEIVALLLSKGAYINLQDSEGNTPLHWAVDDDNYKVVELLLSRGASRKVQNANKITPHKEAIISGARKCQVLLSGSSRFTSIKKHLTLRY